MSNECRKHIYLISLFLVIFFLVLGFLERKHTIELEGQKLSELQLRIIKSRIKKHLPTAYDESLIMLGIERELPALRRALKEEDIEKQTEVICNIMIYCLGGLKILNKDAKKELLKIMDRNEAKEYKKLF